MVEKLNQPEAPKKELEILENSREEQKDLQNELLGVEGLDDIRAKVKAKQANRAEVEVLKNFWIAEGWKVDLSNLVKKHFEMNNSVSTSTEWKELRKKPEYIATIQATLNIMNRPCKITGTYDAETRITLRKFVKERSGKSKVLDDDWYLSAIHKDVLVNALIHPVNIEKARTKDYTNFSSLEFDLKNRLNNTYWNYEDWEIRIPNKRYYMPGTSGNFPYRYPEWTQFNIIDDEE